MFRAKGFQNTQAWVARKGSWWIVVAVGVSCLILIFFVVLMLVMLVFNDEREISACSGLTVSVASLVSCLGSLPLKHRRYGLLVCFQLKGLIIRRR